VESDPFEKIKVKQNRSFSGVALNFEIASSSHNADLIHTFRMGPHSEINMEFLLKMFSLVNKTAVGTGGTRGIGQAMAIAFAEAGADIILIQVRDICP
jgi:hypothetical protein